MKIINKINKGQSKMKAIIKYFFIISIIPVIIGCSQDGISPLDDSNNQEVIIQDFASKKPVNSPDLNTDFRLLETSDATSASIGAYPQVTSVTVQYFKNWGQYKGAICNLENGSFFEFYNGSLSPPQYIPWGDEVTITMRADRDALSGELIYSFGPSGCTFDTPAKLWLDYSDLGTDEATLYYLDTDGNRIEHLPDNIDFYNKRMCIYIDHFSRYAIAYSN